MRRRAHAGVRPTPSTREFQLARYVWRKESETLPRERAAYKVAAQCYRRDASDVERGSLSA